MNLNARSTGEAPERALSAVGQVGGKATPVAGHEPRAYMTREVAMNECRMCGCLIRPEDEAPKESAAYRWAGPVHLACALLAEMEFQRWLDEKVESN